MLPFEVVDPGGSLSMLLLPHHIGKMPVKEGIPATGDGGRQLRPDDVSACPLQWELSAVAWLLQSSYRAGF
jgi:hypothetical protein